MKHEFTNLIADLPDYERVVAEIWDGEQHIAMIDQETERLRLEIFADPNTARLLVDCDELYAGAFPQSAG